MSRPRAIESRWPRATALTCFFLSGAAGLVYEVCWIKRASLVFGSTQEALSTVLAVFFLGLALGSFAIGRIAVGSRRPIRVYAALELALAGLALATIPLFAWTDQLYGGFYRSLSGAPALLAVVRIGLTALVILFPAVLMGGTLPLFVRQFVSSERGILGSVGLLYGINTLGAAIGCAATGLVLIPSLGLKASMAVAAGMNVLAAIAASALRLGAVERSDPAPDPDALQTAKPPGRRPRIEKAARTRAARAESPSAGIDSIPAGPVLAALVFLTGFTALAYEVVWTRFLALLVRNTVTTYTVTLTVVLAGIVAGSWIGSRVLDRPRRFAVIFGVLQVSSGLAVIATLSAPVGFWRSLGDPLVTYAILMLPAAVLSGASFPLAVRLAIRDPRLAALGAGRVAMLNTLGGIVGALAAGFVGLPRLGLHASSLVLTATSLATGFAAWTLLERAGSRWTRGIAIAASVIAWIAIPRGSGTRLPADFLADRASLVDFREGKMSNLAVVRREGIQSLEIDRLWQGQDRTTHQIMAAHLPMLLHPHPRRVLVVGIGSGQSSSRFLQYDVERLDCVDIEPAVFDVIRAHFDARWMSDPRVRVITEDGRNHLVHTEARYDLISLEVGQIFRPGTASFYTVDFYRRARARLAPGGLISQFVPIAFLPPEALRSVIASFLEVFPQSTLWYNTAELLLVGVHADRFELHPQRLDLVRTDARIGEDLSYRHWGGPDRALRQPHVLLGAFLCGPRGLAAIGRGAPVYRDDRPTLEYLAGRVPPQGGQELACLDVLRPRLESPDVIAPSAFPADSLAAMREVQSRNLDQIVSNKRLDPVWTAHSLAEARAPIEAALEANPENAKANGLMGEVLFAEGRFEEALRFYQRSVDMRPEDGSAQLGLANALARVGGRDADAIAHYRAAIAEGVGGADAYYSIGETLERTGDRAGAIRALQQALLLAPGHREARGKLGELLEASGAPQAR